MARPGQLTKLDIHPSFARLFSLRSTCEMECWLHHCWSNGQPPSCWGSSWPLPVAGGQKTPVCQLFTPEQQLQCSALVPPPAISPEQPWPDADALPYVSGTFGRYRVRLAKNGKDRIAACRLRFNVFNLEMGEGLSSSYSTGLDRDRFDPVCDHLIVEDQEDGQVVGTYRMQSGLTAEAAFGYYSAQEFEFAPYECHPRPGSGARPCFDRSPAPLERSADPAVAGDRPIRQTPRPAVPDWLLFPELEGSARRLEPLPPTRLAIGFVRIRYGSHARHFRCPAARANRQCR